ncbi:MAG: hypothetical protein TV41_05385 [Wolbachia endosymbiont of Dactylopius coccus]|nr:MAG: hypothetical protein TV41_05385 [Wolbachia endosymbiont of Dactylopius coccus]
MSFSYYNIKKHPRNFRNITGLTVEEFEKVVEKVRPEWEKVEKQKKCHGRRSQLPTLEDKLFCTILYYRTYTNSHYMANIWTIMEEKP